MAAGSILKEQLLVIEEYTVKASEDIEKGEIVYNDGNGILAAPNMAVGPFMMALQAHDYSEETTHKISCVLVGCVEAQKVSGSGAGKKGQAVMISATAGEVTLFVKGDAPASYAEADVQTALDTNIGIVGTLAEDAEDADTTAKIWLGVK
ncbi:MAG TPA: hypothetical protein VMW03_01635 [Candidatus Krumholzibacteriaceae bacterium]|nr:hypothetical protein [Candidatus Krumholzibacteriaceae bacterium]